MATQTTLDSTTRLNADALHGTVFISDNLPFLKALDTESIDLVCIDPPFGKKQTFEGELKPPLSADERRIERELMDSWGVYDPATAYESGLEYPDQTGTTAKFEDIWNFNVRIYEDWLSDLESTNPGAYWLIQSTRYTHSDSIAAYIAFMVERMIEIRRILKPTGSVYLHCDHEANAYLRQMMDAVFGQSNFRNEIVWKRTNSHGGAKRWGPIHDTVLFYAKSKQYKWNRTYQAYSEEYLEKYYRFEDDRGRYRHVSLTGSGVRSGDSGKEWRGINPTDGGRHWAVPAQSLQSAYPNKNLNGLSTQERLDLLDDAGLVYWPTKGRMPQQRRYSHEGKGVPVQDIIADIPLLSSHDKERTGYPTQKPQALARRIIEASSKPGDIVLDCFAGCAYVPVAAELSGRRWIACDMSPRAWTVVRRQFHKHPDLRIITEGELAAGEGVTPRMENAGRIIRVRGPRELPIRTTSDEPIIAQARPLPEPQFKQHAVETGDVIWTAFVEHWGTACWYCGTDKSADRRELQLDHIEPNRRDGTNDDCWNRALACVACNSDKRDTRTVVETIDFALEQGRISTAARRDEVLAGFTTRHEWAKERWECIKRKQDGDVVNV